MRIETNARLEYLLSLIPAENQWTQKAKEVAQKLNKDKISIDRYEASLLSFFIRMMGCVRFVEFGTLTGYSGLKILEALPPQGHLWTFELNPDHAKEAMALFDAAGFAGRYTLVLGKAEEQVETINSFAPFDGVFIDANKSAYPFYLEWAERSLRSGGVLLADNVLLKGVVPEADDLVADFDGMDESKRVGNKTAQSLPKMIHQLRAFNQKLLTSSAFDSIILPTAEGLALAIKK